MCDSIIHQIAITLFAYDIVRPQKEFVTPHRHHPHQGSWYFFVLAMLFLPATTTIPSRFAATAAQYHSAAGWVVVEQTQSVNKNVLTLF